MDTINLQPQGSHISSLDSTSQNNTYAVRKRGQNAIKLCMIEELSNSTYNINGAKNWLSAPILEKNKYFSYLQPI
jgi:hypothetical protein